MVVFSDLDRSVIYSNKFLDTDIEYANIEVYENKEISYISLDTIKYIKEIQEHGLFIPTTTRTQEQFSRIKFNEKGINFSWAITSNGGKILKDNKVLESWNDQVELMKKQASSIDNMVELFEDYTKLPGVTKFKIVEDLFFYIVVDYKDFNVNSLGEYVSILDNNNWIYYISGRKIYFLPKGLTKENAINYIVKELKINEFCAIGDSTMDEGMLSIANYPYLLKHGDLTKCESSKRFFISEKEGMEGSEQVLTNILERYTQINL